MKFAVLFAGLHYKENYMQGLTRKNNIYDIDYRESLKNIKDNILSYNNPDIYISTNESKISDQLLKDFNPIDYTFNTINFDHLKIKNYNYSVKTYPIKNLRILYGLKLILESKIKYTHIIITRFDIKFKLKLDKLPINYDADWNISFLLENGTHIDDNFWIIKNNIIHKFIDLFKKRKNKKLKTHCINAYINEKNGTSINYIYKDHYNTSKSPLYDLVRIN